MDIVRVFKDTEEIKRLWEENMNEPWSDYEQATKFVQLDDEGRIIGGFAVYWDDSDGVEGHFVSGWSVRKNLVSVEKVIKHLANTLGEIFIKTDKRNVSIIANKLGKFIKKHDEFLYYIVKGE